MSVTERLPPGLFPPELSERFEPVRLLGRGAMGAVFLAREPALDRLVALKVISTRDNRRLVDRMLREAATMAKVDHPNLVRIHDQGLTGRGPYLVLEYVEGRSLDRVPDGEGDPVEILLQVGAGLQALHDAGVVHRDVKPANVLLERGGRALLADLGLAFDPELTRLTGTGVVGTPLYLAPEVARGAADPSPASDWYAWGMTLYRLLEGRQPFTSETVIDLLIGRRDEPWPRPPFERTPAGSPRARTVEACLAEDPDDRPADLAAVRALLEGRTSGALTRPLVGDREAPGRSSSASTRPLSSGALPGAPPRSRRALGWRVAGTTGVALLAIGWISSPGPSPTPASPSPAAPAAEGEPVAGTPPPGDAWPDPDIGDRMLAELEDAADLAVDPYGRLLVASRAREVDRPLLDPDPVHWRSHLRHLEEVDGMLRWIGRGGRVEELAAAVRDGLARVDGFLRERGLPDLFRVYLETRPASEPHRLPLSVRRRVDLDRTSPPFEGWGATAAAALTEALEHLSRFQRELEADPRGPLSGGEMVAVSSFVGATTLDDYLGGVSVRREGRLEVVDWIAPALPAVQRFLYAAGRCLREQPGNRERNGRVFSTGIRRVDAALRAHFATLEVEELLGGPPTHPAGWLLAGELVRRLSTRLATHLRVDPGLLQRLPSYFERALEGPFPDIDARDRRRLAVDRLAENAVKTRDDEAVAGLLRRFRAELTDGVPDLLPETLVTLGLYLAEQEPLPGHTGRDLETLLGACRRKAAAFRDLEDDDRLALDTTIERLEARLAGP